MKILARPLILAALCASAPAAQHEIQELQEPLDIFESLGRSVAVSGTTALVGAPVQDQQRGSVYVYELLGGAWVGTAVLTASDGDTGGLFGITVDLDVTGLVLVGIRRVDAGGPIMMSLLVISVLVG